MVNKLLSVILSIAMLAMVVPVAAFAADGDFALTSPDPAKDDYANYIDVDDDIVIEFSNTLDTANTTIAVSGGGLTAADYTVAVSGKTITIAFDESLLPAVPYTVSVNAKDESANTLSKTIVYNTNPYILSGEYILDQDFDEEGVTVDNAGLTYTSVKDGNTITPSLDGDTDKRLKVTYSNMTTTGQTYITAKAAVTEGILVVEYSFELENGDTYSPARQLAYIRGSANPHTNNFAYYGTTNLTGKGITIAGDHLGDYVAGTEHFIRYVVNLDEDKGEVYLDGKQITDSYATNMTVVPAHVRFMMTNISSASTDKTADLNKAVDYIDDIKIYQATKVTNPALSLQSSNPASNATNVYTGIAPTLTFNNKVNADTVDSITVSGVDDIEADVLEDGKTVKITFPQALADNTEYTIDYSGVRDIYGGACQNATTSFTTAAQNSMLLVSSTPASGSVDVALNTNAVLVFNSAVREDSISMVTIDNGATITDSALSNEGKTLTLTLGGLKSNTEYTVDLAGVRNTEGTYYTGDDYTFTTKNVTAFTLTSSTPADGATAVKAAADVTAEFSNKLDASTLNNITVRGGATNPGFTASANGEKGIKITFPNDLVYNVTYTVDFGGLRDEYGQTIDEEVVFTVEDGYSVKGDYIYYEDFNNTTVDAVGNYITFGTDTTASIVNGKLMLDRPVESSATEISVNKLKDADGNALAKLSGIVGIEFKITMDNPESYASRREIARLIQGSNKQNLAETGSSSSSSRAFRVGGTSQGTYTDGTEYTLKFIVDTVNGQYEAYLDGTKVTETPVAIDSSKFDYTNINQIVFVNSWGGDTRDPNGERTETLDDIKIYYAERVTYSNPTVSGSTPAANATAVSEELTAALTFDQEMDINTVTSDTVYLEKDGTKQAIAISEATISEDKKTVTVKFADDLDFETTYSLVVNGVRSIYGKPATYSASFTTRDGYLKVKEATMSIDGKTITTLVAGEVSASVKIKNYSDTSNTAILILALYDKTAKTLEDVASFGDPVENLPVTVGVDAEVTLNGSITVPNDRKDYILKAYTWDSLGSMIPLNAGTTIESN